MNDNELRQIKNFLNIHMLAALSTVSVDSKPHVAFVYYFYDGEKTLFIGSPKDSRKTMNILKNPYISMAIVEEVSQETLLIDAQASLFTEDKERSEKLVQIYKNLRDAQGTEFSWPLLKIQDTDISVIKVTIDEFRYWDFSEDKAARIEGCGSDLV